MNVIINEDSNIEIENWVFDSIINRTIKYLSEKNEELSELIAGLRYEFNDYFSFEIFDFLNFKITLNAMRDIHEVVSYNRHMEMLTRKSYRLFLKELDSLIYLMIIDSRNQDHLV